MKILTLIFLLYSLGCKSIPEIPDKSKAENLFSIVDSLLLRETPSLEGKALTTLKEGEKLTNLGIKSENYTRTFLRGKEFDEKWIKVKTENGLTGWVYGGGVSSVYPPPDGTFYDLIPFPKNGKLHLYSVKDKKLIPTDIKITDYLSSNLNFIEFDSISGLAKVQINSEGDGFYINREGKTIISFQAKDESIPQLRYNWGEFKEGLAFVGYNELESEKYREAIKNKKSYFINSSGKKVIEIPGLYRSSGFHNGVAILAPTYPNKTSLLVRRDGSIQKFLELQGEGYSFSEGLFGKSVGNEIIAFYDIEGKIKFTVYNVSYSTNFLEEHSAITRGFDWVPKEERQKVFLLTKDGKIQTKVPFNALVSSKINYGFISACDKPLELNVHDGDLHCRSKSYLYTENGKKASEISDLTDQCREGMVYLYDKNLKYDKNFRYGYRNCATGKVEISPQYTYATHFRNGIARVKLNEEEYALIDKAGNILLR